MVDFLKTLVDKFLDFFNVGRAISILLPGVLVAFVLLMLLSLAVFSPGDADIKKDTTTAQKSILAPATSSKAVQKIVTLTNHTSLKPAKATTGAASWKKAEAPPKVPPPIPKSDLTLKPLGARIADDFNRVSNHYWVVMLVSLIIGILLYEIGNVIIAFCSGKSKVHLYRYQEGTTTTLTFDGNKKKEQVGLIYFAPFLKAEFTGKENYYNFLVSEYYRFLEFSSVMPIAMLMTFCMAGTYYLLACYVTKTCCYTWIVIGVLAIIIIIVTLFYKYIFTKVLEGYRKASEDLIKGVSDASNKGIK